MSKIVLNHLEFYITNVCNLTCETCRTFSNYKFSGHYEFDMVKMQQWADAIEIKHIEVLGGEPLLHPRFDQWIKGIRHLWPDADLWLTTNGTRLSKVSALHDVLVDNRCRLKISAHGYNLREVIAKEIFLAFGECKILYLEYGQNKVNFMTSRGIEIELQNGGNLQDVCFTDDRFTLRRSNPLIAHVNCGIKHCHHMIDNKIFKCSVVGLLPEFLRQQGADTTQLLPYHGITVDQVSDDAINRLKNPIPHCSVCPEGNKYRPIVSFFKKDMKFSKDSL